MKLAITTEDGNSISRHFGRAPYYLVVEISEGEVVSQQLRSKAGHKQFAEHGEHHHHDYSSEDHSKGHGFGKQAQDRHAQMYDPIADCEVVISGGMGAGAYRFLQSKGLQTIVTEIEIIPAAVAAFLSGSLKNHTEWLH